MEFDSRSKFSLPHGSMGKHAIIFEVDMNSSVYIGNQKKKNFNSWYTQLIVVIYGVFWCNLVRAKLNFSNQIKKIIP